MLRKFSGLSKSALIVSIAVGGSICALRFLQVFQGLEWGQLDWLFRTRWLISGSEPRDERIVIVGQTEEDIRELREPNLSDRTLVSLLNQVLAQEPRVVGVDIIRDLPEDGWGQEPEEAELAYERLQELFERESKLYAVAKLAGDEAQRVPPPSGVPADRVTDISSMSDEGVLRQKFFQVTKRRWDEQTEKYVLDGFVSSLPVKLALVYLAGEGLTGNDVTLVEDFWGRMVYQIGKGRLVPTYSFLGEKLLVNWRGTLPTPFETVSVSEVLDGEIEPNVFEGKIVLIGSTARSKQDIHYTPLSPLIKGRVNKLYGVETHGNLTSQIISSALDGRPNLETLPQPVEYAIIFLGAGISVCLVCFWHRGEREEQESKRMLMLSLKALIVGVGGAGIALFVSYTAFTEGVWLPFIPFVSAYLVGATIQTFVIYEHEKQHSIEKLEHELARAKGKIEQAKEIQIVFSWIFSLERVGGTIAIEARQKIEEIRQNLEVSQAYLETIEWRVEEKQFCNQKHQDEIRNDVEMLENGLIQIENHVSQVDSFLSKAFESIKESGASLFVDTIKLNEFLENVVSVCKRDFKKEASSFENLILTNFDYSLEKITCLSRPLKIAFRNIVNHVIYSTLERSRRRRGYERKVVIETRNYAQEIEVIIADNTKAVVYEQLRSAKQFLTVSHLHLQNIASWLYLDYATIKTLHNGSLKIDPDPSVTIFVIRLPKEFRKNVPPAIEVEAINNSNRAFF